METRRVRLLYPPALVNTPVIHQLIKKFDITINILKAEINPNQGWVELMISGDQDTIEKAIGWLNSQGIEVEAIR